MILQSGETSRALRQLVLDKSWLCEIAGRLFKSGNAGRDLSPGDRVNEILEHLSLQANSRLTSETRHDLIELDARRVEKFHTHKA